MHVTLNGKHLGLRPLVLLIYYKIVNRINKGEAERCMWRGVPGNISTPLYSTCTPDTATCPDSICDSLEKLHELICPQDCTTAGMKLKRKNETVIYIFFVTISDKLLFPLRVNRKTYRGFDIGEGICFCNVLAECHCIDAEEKKNKNKEKPARKISVTAPKNLTNQNDYNNTIIQPNVSRHIGKMLIL